LVNAIPGNHPSYATGESRVIYESKIDGRVALPHHLDGEDLGWERQFASATQSQNSE
jgi:hypothetical protein